MPREDLQHHVYGAIKRTSKRLRKDLADRDWMVREEAEKALTDQIVKALAIFDIAERSCTMPMAPADSAAKPWGIVAED